MFLSGFPVKERKNTHKMGTEPRQHTHTQSLCTYVYIYIYIYICNIIFNNRYIYIYTCMVGAISSQSIISGLVRTPATPTPQPKQPLFAPSPPHRRGPCSWGRRWGQGTPGPIQVAGLVDVGGLRGTSASVDFLICVFPSFLRATK